MNGDAGATFRLPETVGGFQRDCLGQWQLATIPEGGDLTVVGPSCISGCVEVSCENEVYSVFIEDLSRTLELPESGQSGSVQELVMCARAGGDSPDFALSCIALSSWFQSPAELAPPGLAPNLGLEL